MSKEEGIDDLRELVRERKILKKEIKSLKEELRRVASKLEEKEDREEEVYKQIKDLRKFVQNAETGNRDPDSDYFEFLEELMEELYLSSSSDESPEEYEY